MSISKYTFLVGAMTSILAASTAAADDVAASVAARLRESGQLEDYRVNVKESEGTVFLEGEVTDARQIAAAMAVAENTDGVERVVNRLSLKTVKKRSGITLGLPKSMRGLLGVAADEPVVAAATGQTASPQLVAAGQDDTGVLAMPASIGAKYGEVELVTAEARPMIEPVAEAVVAAPVAEAAPLVEAGPVAEAAQPAQTAVAVTQPPVTQPPAEEVALEEAAAVAPLEAPAVAQPQPLAVQASAASAQPQRANTPRPMAMARASAIPTQSDATRTEQAATKKPSSLASWVKQVAGVMGGERVVPGSERVVPGSERVVNEYSPREYAPQSAAPQGDYYVDQGYADQGYAGRQPQPQPGYVPQGGGLGRPMPMGSAGVGMPPVPMRGDGPNMPNYAWPSYASYPNYAALQYPTQYSPTAFPYIGPFYPYPQVPLGWRRVSLEWDDGWWFLDFDDRAQHH